jgi:hypothetical protein
MKKYFFVPMAQLTVKFAANTDHGFEPIGGR